MYWLRQIKLKINTEKFYRDYFAFKINTDLNKCKKQQNLTCQIKNNEVRNDHVSNDELEVIGLEIIRLVEIKLEMLR